MGTIVDTSKCVIMSDSEDGDSLAPLHQGFDPQLALEVLAAKIGNPSAFVSHWEEDEQDVEEATQEQIQNDPCCRTLWAAETGEMVVLGEMLDKQADLVNCADKDGYTPLHRAAYEGHVEILQMLVSRGGDIHARTVDGWTPLHSAARWSQTEAASYLLSVGAQVNAVTAGGLTALHLAASNAENPHILQLLLLHPDIDVNLTTGCGETAHTLCMRANPWAGLFDIHHPYINTLKLS